MVRPAWLILAAARGKHSGSLPTWSILKRRPGGSRSATPASVAAKQLLTTVLSTSFYDMRPPGRWSNGSVSLAFNNPPYDWSSFEENRNGQKRKVRHEVLFIEGTTPKIVPGGHQVIIVPRGILGESAAPGGRAGRAHRPPSPGLV